MSETILTILIITYNHEDFITQAIEGALHQKTKYKYVIKIFDDCSSDKTAKIAKTYADKFPQKVQLFVNKKNLGNFLNCAISLEVVEGKYFTILDGDDFFLGETKIEEQISLLEQDPNLSGCGHRNYVLKNGAEMSESAFVRANPVKASYTFSDVLQGQFYCHTSSMIYSTKHFAEFKKIKFGKYREHLGDFFALVFFSQFSNLVFIDKHLSVYRITGRGIWTKISDSRQNEMHIQKYLIYRKLVHKEFIKELNLAFYFGVSYFINQLKESKGHKIKIIQYTILLKSLTLLIKPNTGHLKSILNHLQSLCLLTLFNLITPQFK